MVWLFISCVGVLLTVFHLFMPPREIFSRKSRGKFVWSQWRDMTAEGKKHWLIGASGLVMLWGGLGIYLVRS
jgi:hypothetical protein